MVQRIVNEGGESDDVSSLDTYLHQSTTYTNYVAMDSKKEGLRSEMEEVDDAGNGI